jgi:hypothetical protein
MAPGSGPDLPAPVSRASGPMNRPGCVAGIFVMMRRSPRLRDGRGSVRRFAAARDARELRMLRTRIEGNGPIAAVAGVAEGLPRAAR